MTAPERKGLRRVWVSIYDSGAVGGIWHDAISQRPVAQIGHDFAEYTRSDLADAAVAAAYEVAASICDEERHNMNAMFTNPPQSAAAVGSRNRIRALIDADALAALEAVKREARMEGFRAGFEQATICDFDDWKDAWAISKMNTAQEDAP